tara:strand:+ start:4211 stop:4339 length:129 start_codon:yes stop_codon:yes gene_type:complete
MNIHPNGGRDYYRYEFCWNKFAEKDSIPEALLVHFVAADGNH